MNKTLAKKIRRTLSLEQMTTLCSGKNNWETESYPEKGVFGIKMADGPHGLRVEQEKEGEKIGVGEGLPATCFPTAAISACSFDPNLIFEMAAAIAREARAQQVDLILGPGLNMKRSPLCGRNFEYYSEDPCLSGNLAASFVNGAASEKVGAVLKHFLANNQETRRMTVDVCVDDRTLREIYLKGFEIALEKSKPMGVMCAYNSVNGEFMSQNKTYLTDILRKEWGFEGITMTDWGAVYDRVKGIEAGLDLEMPGSGSVNDRKVYQAVKKGLLKITSLNASVERLIGCALEVQANRKTSQIDMDQSSHHVLAEKIAEESMVLLQNDEQILPLDRNQKQKIAVIGKMLYDPRFQGAGSSRINAEHVDVPYDTLRAYAGDGVSFSSSQGYSDSDLEKNEKLLREAVQLASESDRVLLFAGLPEEIESEGYDRSDLQLPQNQQRLIDAICEVNPKTVLILISGGVLEWHFTHSPSAILWAGLSGEAMGTALAKILFGEVNPSGKLAETFPLRLEETPSFLNFPGIGDQVVYGEGIFVGYRYYDRIGKKVRYPFGYGLSYTSFSYRDLTIEKDRDQILVHCFVKNTGDRFGKEILQLYTGKADSKISRPLRELRAFQKIALNPGEEKQVTFELKDRDFMYYDPNFRSWRLEDGEQTVEIGASCEDIRLTGRLTLYNEMLPPLTPYAYLADFMNYPRGREVVEECYRQFQAMTGQTIDEEDDFFMALFKSTPVIKIVSYSHGFVTEEALKAVLDYINGEGETCPDLLSLCGSEEPEKFNLKRFLDQLFGKKTESTTFNVDSKVKDLLENPEALAVLKKYCPPEYFEGEIVETVKSMGLTVRKIQRLIPDEFFPPSLLQTIDQELSDIER